MVSVSKIKDFFVNPETQQITKKGKAVLITTLTVGILAALVGVGACLASTHGLPSALHSLQHLDKVGFAGGASVTVVGGIFVGGTGIAVCLLKKRQKNEIVNVSSKEQEKTEGKKKVEEEDDSTETSSTTTDDDDDDDDASKVSSDT